MRREAFTADCIRPQLVLGCCHDGTGAGWGFSGRLRFGSNPRFVERARAPLDREADLVLQLGGDIRIIPAVVNRPEA